MDLALVEVVVEPEHDPPKLLIIGPDPAGNLLELVGGEFASDLLVIWHADRCRRRYLDLLRPP